MEKTECCRIRFLFSVFLLLATALLSIISPILMGNYIEALTKKTDSANIVTCVIILTISWLIGVVLTYVTSVNSTHLKTRLTYSISLHLLNHTEHLPYSKLIEHNPVYLTSRIQNDSNTITSFFLDGFIGMIVQALLCITVLIFLFNSSRPIFWLVMITLPIYFLIYKNFSQRIESSSKKVIEQRDKFFGEMNHQLRNIHTIKANVWYTILFSLLKGEFEIFYKSIIKNTKIGSRYSSLTQLIQIAFNVIIFLVCGFSVQKDVMSLGNFIAVNSLLSILLSSFTDIMGCGKDYAVALAAFSRIVGLESTAEERIGSLKMDAIHEVSFEKVSFSHSEQGENLINQVSVKFKKGEIYQIIGCNGSGKTTLIDIMLGLHPASGKIYYNKMSTENLDMPYIRKNLISTVEQEPPLVFRELLQNISAEKFGSDYLMHEIDSMGMSEFLGSSEFLSNHKSTSVVHNISGGEKQKIAILRALLKRPQLLILDEPASALDVQSCKQLKGLLQREKSDRITILIDHQSAFTDIIDVAYLLQDGHLLRCDKNENPHVPFPKKQTQKRSRKPNEPKVLNQPAQSGKQNAREPATPKQSGDANDYKKPQCTQKCRPESEPGKQNAEGEGARLLSN
ncbi:ATP-binding cassette domain-containing protein [Acutalibacter muris]